MTQSLSAKQIDRLQRERNVALRQRDALLKAIKDLVDNVRQGYIPSLVEARKAIALTEGGLEPRPSEKKVMALFQEGYSDGSELWLCTKCGASTPPDGHTIKACEEYQNEVTESQKEAIADAMKKTI